MRVVRLPEMSRYGEYASSNHAWHALRFDVGNLTIWFSYTTPVAFQVHGHDRVICENVWSPTTGKHLNWINPDHQLRVTPAEFQRQWGEQVSPLVELEL